MSNVLVEMTAADLRTDVIPGPQSAFESGSAIRLSAELVAVLARWLRPPRWRHGVSPALPEYRRYLD